MKDIREMSIDELIAEMEKQNRIASDAYNRAVSCESKAISNFLRENKLNGIVMHNKTNTKGVLAVRRELTRGFLVEFYPLKKDGTESMNKSLDCTEWASYRSLKENFEVMLQSYTVTNDKTKGVQAQPKHQADLER